MAERKEEILNPKVDEEVKQASERREAVSIIDRLVPRDKADHEVESWLEKIEKDPQQIQDQQMGKTTTSLQSVKQRTDDLYQVPITKRDFIAGFKQSIDDVAKWLSVFVLRIVKKKQGKVKFNQEENKNE